MKQHSAHKCSVGNHSGSISGNKRGVHKISLGGLKRFWQQGLLHMFAKQGVTSAKSLVLACALLAGAATTCMGAGFAKAFAIGCNYMANDLNAAPNNNIMNVLPVVPENTSVFKYIAESGHYQAEIFSEGAWEPGTMVLNPGDGAILMTDTAFLAFFAGAVPLGLPCKCMAGDRFYLLGRRVAGMGPSSYDDIVGVPPVEGATLYQFIAGPGNNCGGPIPGPNYVTYSFTAGAWAPAPPVVAVGESVWVKVPPMRLIIGGGLPACPAGSTFSVNWSGGCWALESAPAPGGPWAPVFGFGVPPAPAPFCAVVPPAGFYRLVCP